MQVSLPIPPQGLDHIREYRLAPAVFDARIETHARELAKLQALGLTTAEAFLNLPGQIVSGHPDRHVMRIELADGRICFLKKEHRIRWKDRFENWRAGFGWTTKSAREGRILWEMERRGLSAPRCLAFGENGDGRAFALIAAIENAVDLRRFVHSHHVDEELVIGLGRFVADLHAGGIDHPDLYAKHFLINPDTVELTLLDWQRTRLAQPVCWRRRIDALASLAATLPTELDRRERTHLLWGYLRRIETLEPGAPALPFANLAKAVANRIGQLERRRGIREQRQPPLDASAQRLVWLDGEAVCALATVAGELKTPKMQSALYDSARAESGQFFCGGRQVLHRVGRYRALFRSRSWRTPEARLARLLFHLERHHVNAPKLLAYGQRRNRRRFESFILHEAPPESIRSIAEALSEANPFRCEWLLQNLADLVGKLHEAGCEIGSLLGLSVSGDSVFVSDPTQLVFRRHLSHRRKSADCRSVIRSMQSYCGPEELRRFAERLENNSRR